jgi:hypothetical protein
MIQGSPGNNISPKTIAQADAVQLGQQAQEHGADIFILAIREGEEGGRS